MWHLFLKLKSWTLAHWIRTLALPFTIRDLATVAAL